MTPRSSKLNQAAAIGAIVFAGVACVAGHWIMAVAISLLGSALCIAVMTKEPLK